MKKQLITLSVLLITASAAQAQTKSTSAKSTAKPAATASKSAALSVSENMKGFMAMFNGDSKAVEDALAKYEKQGLERHDMDMYNLADAKVVSAEATGKQEKYTMEVKSGVTTRKYEIHWEDGKISEVKDLGLKM